MHLSIPQLLDIAATDVTPSVVAEQPIHGAPWLGAARLVVAMVAARRGLVAAASASRTTYGVEVVIQPILTFQCGMALRKAGDAIVMKYDYGLWVLT